MRLMGLWLLSGVLLIGAFTGCQKKTNDQYPSGTIQVQLPWFENGEYKLKIIDLVSIEDMIELKGWAARFFMSPKIEGKDVIGLSPRIRTIRNKSGVYIASDDLSLQLLTFYAHLEKLALFDEQVGAKDIGQWPKKVAVQTNFITPQGSTTNNAFYLGSANAFIFVPYTKQDLPVMINAGVIGHEHFHSLFHSVILDKINLDSSNTSLFNPHEIRDDEFLGRINNRNNEVIKMSERDQYHVVLLRGLNEGLADVWGWLYSGDTEFVGRSLPEMSFFRSLKGQSEGVMHEDWIKYKIKCTGFNNHQQITALSYDIGIRYARSLTQMLAKYAENRNLEKNQAKELFGRWIIQSLKELGSSLLKLKEDEMISTEEFYKILQLQIGDLSPDERLMLTIRRDSEKSKFSCAR